MLEARALTQEPNSHESNAWDFDRSVTYPLGVLENVIIKVDWFYLPVYFVVLDMEEDKDVPLIFGRPFMATARTLIEVEEGTLTIRIMDESVVFKLFDVSKKPHNEDECFRIEGKMTCKSSLPHLTKLQFSIQLGAIPLKLLVHQSHPLPPSIERPPRLELKPLLVHLKYAYLQASNTLPVIIAADLNEIEDKLLRFLREYKTAIGWTIADIKGINPALCMHIILLEAYAKPTIEA
ncbi:unnamed protein product [Prunus armeniaca]